MTLSSLLFVTLFIEPSQRSSKTNYSVELPFWDANADVPFRSTSFLKYCSKSPSIGPGAHDQTCKSWYRVLNVYCTIISYNVLRMISRFSTEFYFFSMVNLNLILFTEMERYLYLWNFVMFFDCVKEYYATQTDAYRTFVPLFHYLKLLLEIIIQNIVWTESNIFTSWAQHFLNKTRL